MNDLPKDWFVSPDDTAGICPQCSCHGNPFNDNQIYGAYEQATAYFVCHVCRYMEMIPNETLSRFLSDEEYAYIVLRGE